MKIGTKVMLLYFVYSIFLRQCKGMHNGKQKDPRNSSSSSNKRRSSTPTASTADRVVLPEQKQCKPPIDNMQRQILTIQQEKIYSSGGPPQTQIRLESLNLLKDQCPNFERGSSSKVALKDGRVENMTKLQQKMMELNWPNAQKSVGPIDGKQIGQIESVMPLEAATPRQWEHTESLKAKKDFLDNMWLLIMLSFELLRIQLAPIDQLMMQVQQGEPFFDAEQLNLALQQMNTNEILSSIGTFLVPNELVQKNNLFKEIFAEINIQAKDVFGYQLFEMKHVEPQNIITFERIFVEADTFEIITLKVLYFYKRLLRKLAGHLETPYNAKYLLKDNLNRKQSERKFIVSWISKVMPLFSKWYDAMLKGPNIINAEKKISGTTTLEKLDLDREIIIFAHFSIRQTLAPFFEEPNHVLSSISKKALITLMYKTYKNNIVCLMLSKESPDYNQIAMNSAFSINNYGASAVFLSVLFNLIEKQKNKFFEQPMYKSVQNANIYLAFYQFLLKLINTIDQSMISIFLELEHKLLKKFLEESVAQFVEFKNRWESDKEFLLLNKVTEAGFVSDYLMDHCIQFILKANAKERVDQSKA